MTSFTLFVDIPNTWFVDPVGYSVMCRGDCLGYGVVNIDDGLPCNSTSPKGTKLHKMNELAEHEFEDMVSYDKR